MNLPDNFIEQLRGLLPDEWEALAEAITTTEPSVAVRVVKVFTSMTVRHSPLTPTGMRDAITCRMPLRCSSLM